MIPKIDIPCFAWNSQAEQGLLFFKAKSLLSWKIIRSIRLYVEDMAVTHADRIQNTSDTIDDAMNELFSKLDEAIDDMEAGRVLIEEELWAEIDAI